MSFVYQTNWAGLKTWVSPPAHLDNNLPRYGLALLHGYGAHGQDLLDVGRALQNRPNVFLLLPQAPLALVPDHNQFAWWPLDWNRLQAIQQGDRPAALSFYNDPPQGMEATRHQLADWITHATKDLQLTSSNHVVLGGFSQGAMLAADLCITQDIPLAALLLFSGATVNHAQWQKCQPRPKNTPCFQSHGKQDPILPFFMAETLHLSLQDALNPVWFCVHPFGHDIPKQVLADASRFLERLVIR